MIESDYFIGTHTSNIGITVCTSRAWLKCMDAENPGGEYFWDGVGFATSAFKTVNLTLFSSPRTRSEEEDYLENNDFWIFNFLNYIKTFVISQLLLLRKEYLFVLYATRTLYLRHEGTLASRFALFKLGGTATTGHDFRIS